MTKTAKTPAAEVEDVVEAVAATTKTIEIPTSAREFVQRAAKSVQEGADALNARAHDATSAIETAIGGSATTAVKAARKVQDTIYEDVKSALAAIEKLSKSANLAEAAQVQIDYLTERGQVQIARMKSATELFVKALQDGAKSTQDAVAKLTAMGSKAA